MADTGNNFTFRLNNNSRNEIVIEGNLSLTTSPEPNSDKAFFYEEYQKAYRIVEKLFPKLFPRNNDGNDKSNENNNRDYNEARKDQNHSILVNNTIVFSGPRGSGKTSAMRSFAYFLESGQNSENFYILKMIDPSLFKENESILLSLLSTMFQTAKSLVGDKNNKISKFNSLAKQFGDVFKNIIKTESKIKNEHTLEYLNELSNLTTLKDNIRKLIKEFISFMDDRKKVLVVMIDDLDMNLSFAREMLEEIRKYLLQDNILILFATNLDQLYLELKEGYAKYFTSLRNNGNNSVEDNVGVDVEDMATKYLLKLFPPLQRIHLSNVSNKLVNAKLAVKGNSGAKENQREGMLQQEILKLIWEKTRLIFIPPKRSLHPIIPTNLRALSQFIYMLIDMPEYNGNEEQQKKQNRYLMTAEEIEKLRNNFYIFKDYILNVWIPSNVSYEEYVEFENIPKEIDRVNKHLIQAINVIGSKYKAKYLLKDLSNDKSETLNNELREREEKFKPRKFDKSTTQRDIYTFVSPNDPRFSMANKISDIYNFPSNNSMGDILLLVDKYKTYFEAANANNFIEAVKIYYSLLLFETMFFDSNSYFQFYNNKEETKEAPKAQVTNIQKLIGGTMFFPHYFEIIYSENYKNRCRGIVSKIDKMIDSEIKSNSELNLDDTVKIITDKIKKRLEVAEYLKLNLTDDVFKKLEDQPEEHIIDEISKQIADDIFKKLEEQIKDKCEEPKNMFNQIADDVFEKLKDQAEEHIIDEISKQIAGDIFEKLEEQIKDKIEESKKDKIEESKKDKIEESKKISNQIVDDIIKKLKEQIKDKIEESKKDKIEESKKDKIEESKKDKIEESKKISNQIANDILGKLEEQIKVIVEEPEKISNQIANDILGKLEEQIKVIVEMPENISNQIADDIIKKLEEQIKDKIEESKKISNQIANDILGKLEEQIKVIVEMPENISIQITSDVFKKLKKQIKDKLEKLRKERIKDNDETSKDKEKNTKLITDDIFKEILNNYQNNKNNIDYIKNNIDKIKNNIDNIGNNIFKESSNKKYIKDKVLYKIIKLKYLYSDIGITKNTEDEYVENIVRMIYDKYYNKQNDVEEHLFYHDYFLNPTNDKNENLFFRLYYGSSRPERSMGKHIYNTKRKEDKNTYQSVRFDMLALLVNMLNPIHTLRRTIVNQDDYKTYIKTNKIGKCYDIMKTKENELIKVPNCIFPIYSVDMMLEIIKKGIDSQYVFDRIGKTPIKQPNIDSDVVVYLENILKLESQYRDKEFIEAYYGEISVKVSKMLRRITGNKDNEMYKRYQKIHDKIKNIFIEKV